MAHTDELRLIARVARMYYLDALKQSDIASRLRLSQATVSRLIRRGHDEGIVHIRVDAPRGTFPELEARLQQRYGLAEVVVAEAGEEREPELLRRVGEAAAHYLETTLGSDETLGISSWSESLLRMVDSLAPLRRQGARSVVQILGGMGNPGVQAHATNITVRLARLTNAEPKLLTAQGVAASPDARDALVADPYVRQTMALFPSVTTALVGIGAVEPSKLLAHSGNIFTEAELAELRARGAVGDICLHFFAQDGTPIEAPIEKRVIGITLAELRAIGRVVGVACGRRKVPALIGAMRSGLIDVLITDQFTAQALDETALDETVLDRNE